MKILVVSQNKGGTGKTSTSRIIAEFCARRGVRTLLLDLDPQCSLSQRYLEMQRDLTSPDGILPPVHPEYDPTAPEDANWDGISSSANIILAPERLYAYSTQIPNLDIIPGNGQDLRRVELVREDDVSEQIYRNMRDFLRSEDMAAEYDLVVVDTSPSKGPLTTSAMRAATHVIIPTIMEPQGVEGLQGMLMMFRAENYLRAPDDLVQLVGILPNKITPRLALNAGLLESLRSNDALRDYVMPCHLGQRVAFAEADHESVRPRSVFDWPKKDPARLEAEAVGQYVAEKLGLDVSRPPVVADSDASEAAA